MAKAKPSPVYPEAHDPKTFCDDLTSLLNVFVTVEAEWCVQVFAIETGIPRDRVVSDALLYWWSTYGAFATKEEEGKVSM